MRDGATWPVLCNAEIGQKMAPRELLAERHATQFSMRTRWEVGGGRWEVEGGRWEVGRWDCNLVHYQEGGMMVLRRYSVSMVHVDDVLNVLGGLDFGHGTDNQSIERFGLQRLQDSMETIIAA